MSYRLQICVDAHDPHAQADWWAQTLGWEVEPSDEAFIRSMVEQGFAADADTMTHRGVLVWREGQAVNPPPDLAGAPRLLFQAVPEPKVVKNRAHLDVRLDGDDKDAIREALIERGAAYVSTHRQGPHTWHVMTDPEGNEFCIS